MKRVVGSIWRSLKAVVPTCDGATRIASGRLDGPVSLGQQVRLGLHLVICVWCRRYVRQIAFLRRAMRNLAETPGEGMTATLPAEARERTRQALRVG